MQIRGHRGAEAAPDGFSYTGRHDRNELPTLDWPAVDDLRQFPSIRALVHRLLI